MESQQSGFKLSGHSLSRGLACGRRIRSRRSFVVDDEERDFRLYHSAWQESRGRLLRLKVDVRRLVDRVGC
jgi:hypothetical protein